MTAPVQLSAKPLTRLLASTTILRNLTNHFFYKKCTITGLNFQSELYHWVDVLDMFDDIMERCCQTVDGNKWMLACDEPENTEVRSKNNWSCM